MEWYEIFAYVVGITGVVIGTIFYTKYDQFVKLLKETGEAFTETADALADKKLTKAEAVECLKEWYEVYIALMELIPKKLAAKILNK